jgi:hypothetical protein
MLAGSMIAWGHYFVFLIFPMAVAVVCASIYPSITRLLIVALIFLALNVHITRLSPFFDRHIYLKILVFYIPLYGLMGLGILLANAILKSFSTARGEGEQLLKAADYRLHHTHPGRAGEPHVISWSSNRDTC